MTQPEATTQSRPKRECFIIGPMKDQDKPAGTRRLERLRDRVLRPIFDDIQRDFGDIYECITPFELSGIGTPDIVINVMDAIDKADVIVADLTDGNPNVFYELGVCHSLGKPTVLLMEKNEKASIEFYVSRYYVPQVELDPDTDEAYTAARAALNGTVRRINESISNWQEFRNPVTEFFSAPLTYISPSFALAQGYFDNFIEPVIQGLTALDAYRNYQQAIGYSLTKDVEGGTSRVNPDHLLSHEERRNLVMHIVVPVQIAYTKEFYVSRFQGGLQNLYIDAVSRIRTVQYRQDDEENILEMVDLPTTIRTMESAIKRRMTSQMDYPGSERWKRVERQEIERFRNNLQFFADTHQDNPRFRQHIKISLYDPDDPAEDLQWLHELLQY